MIDYRLFKTNGHLADYQIESIADVSYREWFNYYHAYPVDNDYFRKSLEDYFGMNTFNDHLKNIKAAKNEITTLLLQGSSDDVLGILHIVAYKYLQLIIKNRINEGVQELQTI